MNLWALQLFILIVLAAVSYGSLWLITQGKELVEQDEPTSPLEPPYHCKFCGAPSWLHPSEQEWPVDYCHESDHGTIEDYRG